MELEAVASRLEMLLRFSPGAVIGYTSGVFDLFHEGHLKYLTKCRMYCDILVVGVDSDAMVSACKSSARPIKSASVRMLNVERISNFCFEKTKSSLFYAEILNPAYHFFPTNKLECDEKLRKLSGVPGFIDFIKIEYTESISTTKLIFDSGGVISREK